MIRILLADDHAIVRKGLKQLILDEFPSAEVGEVGDVESLVASVMKGKWDVIVSDISMPGRSGVEALYQIKEINPSIPVLIMSMHPEDQYALRVLKAGASGYLNKDSVHEELIPAIHMVRNGRKYITPTLAETLATQLEQETQAEPHKCLSDREFEVFKLLAAGKAVSEIAESLRLSATTISTYRSRVLSKMNLKTNSDLTRYALENKLI